MPEIQAYITVVVTVRHRAFLKRNQFLKVMIVLPVNLGLVIKVFILGPEIHTSPGNASAVHAHAIRTGPCMKPMVTLRIGPLKFQPAIL